MIERLQAIRYEYPKQFWILFFGSLINSIGGGLIFPFFSLYLTRQLNFSMTEVGVIFVIFAIVSVFAQLIGGTLVDRLGRKPIMVLSLFGDAAGVACMGLAGTFIPLTGSTRIIYIAVIILFLGTLGALFPPAVNAMVADLLEPRKRAEGYGLLRVVMNLGVAIGPAIGGFIATRSYLILFLGAALATTIYGFIILFLTHETKPYSNGILPAKKEFPGKSESLKGVFYDTPFMIFGGLVFLSNVVYSQMNTTLPVYLNRNFGVTEQWYGLLMSLNAAMVVLFQFFITRITDRYVRSSMMAVGMMFYAIGFGMFGFVGTLSLFFMAQALWTVGEMIAIPVSQAFAADIAPATMRGRYLGVFGVMYGASSGLGPLLGGLIMDKWGGRYIWYAAIVLNALAMGGFLAMGRLVPKKTGK